MRTFLFFQPSLNGHFLEYLHHEYMGALSRENDHFVFVVPESIKKQGEELSWPKGENVDFCFVPDDDMSSCNQVSAVRRSLSQSFIIGKLCKKYKVDICFLNDLINAMPFIVFFLPRRCRVSGILYGIYRWNKDQLPFKKKMFNNIIYKLYSKKRYFKNVFLLNDSDSPTYYNRLFNTTTFSYIPDPINISIDYIPKDNLRAELGIKPTDEVFLQLVVQKRKHPFEILDAIRHLPNHELNNKVFIFTGNIEKEIEGRFLQEVEMLRTKVRIILKTGWVSYETIYDMFQISNYCFTLYDNTNMSSGVLGYAAYFNTKVIGVNNGLLGFLVNKYRLGICVNEIKQEEIRKAMLDITDYPTTCNDYVKNNSIGYFVNTIFNN